jgi:hypothetical protein
MLCRGLKFAQKPDYNGYRKLLERMRDRTVRRCNYLHINNALCTDSIMLM